MLAHGLEGESRTVAAKRLATKFHEKQDLRAAERLVREQQLSLEQWPEEEVGEIGG